VNTSNPISAGASAHGIQTQGTQTLERGLAVLEAVGAGCVTLAEIGIATGCTRSTTQRLTSALVRHGWVAQAQDGTYLLGERLMRLAGRSDGVVGLAAIARPVLERLGLETQDTIHLGVRSGSNVLYADKVPGRRGLEMRSRTGQLMPLVLTGVGRALLLDASENEWRDLLSAAKRPVDVSAWITRMQTYRASGVVFDLEDNEQGINCVAAPVRAASGAILCAISVASATPYLPMARLQELAPMVAAAAADVGRLLNRNGGQE